MFRATLDMHHVYTLAEHPAARDRPDSVIKRWAHSLIRMLVTCGPDLVRGGLVALPDAEPDIQVADLAPGARMVEEVAR